MTKSLSTKLLVIAPRGIEGTGVVAAAGRASALGFLDCGSTAPRDSVPFARIRRWTSAPFGLRISGRALMESRTAWESAEGLQVVCLPEGIDEGPGIEAAVIAVRGTSRIVLAEVFDRSGIRRAEAAGVDGLIVSGNEAGGWCGSDSSFVLLQAALATSKLPVWVRGGIGERVAAGAVAAGASGVVLDGALLLARESSIGEDWRDRMARWDGTETVAVMPVEGPGVRVFARPGSAEMTRLRESPSPDLIGWSDGQCPPVGQDAALASKLARKYVTVGGIVQAVDRAIGEGIAAAQATRPMAAGSPMAIELGTQYPILQGPMTRVSDVAAFAEAVAREGAVPFVAMAMLHGPEALRLLDETATRLNGRPWGVGILGFVSPELRAEQLEAVARVRPPWALIAGGRPDQSATLERQGIRTFLHVPSPGLLEQYLREGCRRFVLEGRECGGHVGPRSSFVLWEQAVAVVAEAIDRGIPANEIALAFAGGIHDARSSAMVAGLAGPIAARGVKVGALIGTAYLFTREAVETGAIVQRFQQEAIRCQSTVLLESGPGHLVRVSPSPFAGRFNEERRRMIAEGRPTDEVREALEGLNVGRLRVAAKGIERHNGSPPAPVDDDYQKDNGLYMLGQAATLRDTTTTMEKLHREIATDATALVDRIDALANEAEKTSKPSDIAIVGMASVFPGAGDVQSFWSNTLRGIDAITEVPTDRWDWRLYYDSDPKAPDKIISKWGGFVPDVPFDPLRYGMPPSSLPSIEPAQLLALEVVRRAIDDAGYADRPFARERTAVVLGMGGGAAQLAMGYAFRSYLPMLDTVIPGGGGAAVEACKGQLPEWTEDSFPGFLLNVTAGRIANRLNLGGANYTVDAACGSSLAAASLAVRELETGAADVVVLGGVDTVQNPFTYLAFSKTQAFSPRGRCRPFDVGADGIVISEGVAAVVLKRLADAERDGDRIYAVIKGVGASSDGRARGLTAPVVEGQMRAIERAYARAGVSPTTVGYVEAHGTGTALGDVVEFESLSRVFRDSGTAPGTAVVGSVKSMIGHTKCAAGLAGLINASMALYQKVKPPTIGIETPNPKLDLRDGPFRLGPKAEPWLHSGSETPRRAGVSAFGFGGTNFHAVLEEYRGNTTPPPASGLADWPSELFVLDAEKPAGLVAAMDRLAAPLRVGARPPLRDLSHTVNRVSGKLPRDRAVLAIVAESHEDLIEKLRVAREAIDGGCEAIEDARGVYYAARSAWAGAKVAFLFPGQGSQFPGMLREMAVAFPEIRESFEEFDRAVIASGGTAPGPLVFPPPAFDDTARRESWSRLARTDVAQPAVGAGCVGMLRLFRSLGLSPDMVAGHSFGELVALHAANALDSENLALLSSERGQLMLDAGRGEAGAMAAILAPPESVARLLVEVPDVRIANENGPRQTVVAGLAGSVERLLCLAAGRGVEARRLNVSSAFHSPMVAAARQPFAERAARSLQRLPDRPVYSNIDAGPHPSDLVAIANRLGEHIASPVRFAAMIEAMYRDGARVFVEVGPGAVLTPMIGSILEDQPHLAVSSDASPTPGLSAFLRRLARLVVAGVSIRLDRLTEGRSSNRLDLDRLPPGPFAEPPSASTWLVNGSRSRPIAAPEPRRLGTGQALPIPSVAPPPSPAREAPVAPAFPRHDQGRGHRNGKPSPSMTNQHAALPKAPTPGAADPVLESFQKTMQVFLEVQKATMLAYLNGRGGAPGSGYLASSPNGSIPHVTPASAPYRNGEAIIPEPRDPRDVATSEHRPKPPSAPVREHTFGNGQAPTVSSSPAAPDRESITTRLLEIVRDRTGYPMETLGLELDIEADLGIDSIKRVEILGKLRDEFPGIRPPSDSSDAMDALARARTLGAIVDRMLAMSGSPRERSVSPSQTETLPIPDVPRVEVIERRVLEIVEAPLPTDRGGLMPGGRVVLTDDGRGIAVELARRLESEGVESTLLKGVDWTSPDSIEIAMDEVRASGPIAGIVHAMPMGASSGDGSGIGDWADRIDREVKGLFLLARASAPDLETAASSGGACLVAATSMGGRFGTSGDRPFFPGHGGIAGLVKTLAREWPNVRCRLVDLDPADTIDGKVSRLADEVLALDGWAEVGYDQGRRVRLQSVARALVRRPSEIELAPGEPVLITGGARGITGLVAAELAQAWRPTLLIVGTTPEPVEPEPDETRSLVGEAELKAALHLRMRSERRPAGPAEIEAAYQSLRRAREVRENLERLRATGARVEYARADVRDPSALSAALGGWRARYGDPVGLIHGAGLIKDKLIREKSPDSFDRVLGTKVQGALNLVRLVRPDSLKFTALFSSIAGRFGNVGQSDYAAANEFLSKLAHWLDRKWPGRVVSVIWGPWSGVGMVSQLEGHLGRRGLGMIAPEIGRGLLLEELRSGRKGDVEVIYAGGLGTLEDPLPIIAEGPIAEVVR